MGAKWRLGGLLVFPLAMALGCGGGDGGAGGDGGPSDGGGIDAPVADAAVPECQCFSGESCPARDGVCSAPPSMFLLVRDQNGAFQFPYLCPLEGGLGEPLVAEMGGCRLTTYAGVPPATSYDSAGELEVAGSFGSAVFPSPLTACRTEPVTDGSLIDGDLLTFTGSGGADLPAFSVSTTVPATTTFEIPETMVRGQDFTVTWSATEPDERGVLLISGSQRVRCYDFSNSGAITVPAAMTSMLDVGGGSAYGYVSRRARDYLDTGVAVELAVQRVQLDGISITDPP